mmetsp:Transcript_27932/g.86607  ORF Transcript_27932/g.86607 Transcript_27932/m.86607 type:complete len:88 (-) Transcript_27932:8-271(-)
MLPVLQSYAAETVVNARGKSDAIRRAVGDARNCAWPVYEFFSESGCMCTKKQGGRVLTFDIGQITTAQTKDSSRRATPSPSFKPTAI